MENGILNIADCDVGFSINGTNYTFDHVDGVTIEDPRRSHLIRGVNSTSKRGLRYREGTASPYVVTVRLKSIGVSFEGLLRTQFDNDGRIDFWVIDRATGSNKKFQQACLQNAPKQLSITEGEDNLDIELVLESFDFTGDYK
jgi:hypothetical protein